MMPKKKKIIDQEEEERMKAILKKPADAATLANDKLRPWTVNPATEGILRSELGKLDKTIIMTSPQMSAGDIGFSVLDRKLPEIEDFKSSFKTRTKLNPYKSIYEDYIIQYQNQVQPVGRFPGGTVKRRGTSGNTAKNEKPFVLLDNISNANSRTHSGQGSSSNYQAEERERPLAPVENNNNNGNSNNNSRRYSTTPKPDDVISEVDTNHVERVQRMIQAKSLSNQNHTNFPLSTVQFKPFKSPAVFPVSTSEYQKMRHEMQSFPKPQTAVLLNHRNQIRMMSIVNSHSQHEDNWYNHRERLHRTKNNRATKSSLELTQSPPEITQLSPEIRSSYFHVPAPGSS